MSWRIRERSYSVVYPPPLTAAGDLCRIHRRVSDTCRNAARGDQPCENPQAPGPPGMPQPWHGVGVSLKVVEEAAVTAANVDSFFCKAVLPHWGHAGAGVDDRINFSNSLLQSRH